MGAQSRGCHSRDGDNGEEHDLCLTCVDANFNGADLTGASIESVDFENADLTNAILSEAQVL